MRGHQFLRPVKILDFFHLASAECCGRYVRVDVEFKPGGASNKGNEPLCVCRESKGKEEQRNWKVKLMNEL